jgi:hypothetical protein
MFIIGYFPMVDWLEVRSSIEEEPKSNKNLMAGTITWETKREGQRKPIT